METTQHRFAENGKVIRRARRRTGLSQENFAVQVGTTRRHMIRLENGEHLPTRALRDRILEQTGSQDEIRSSDDEDEESSLTVDLLQLAKLARLASLLEEHPEIVESLTREAS